MARFIVVEGIDGCGKSSVAASIAESMGDDAVLTREPTDSWIGKAVRKGEKGDVSPYLDALLFMADRAQHTLEINGLLEQGKTVVCDRYYHSTVAYQTAHLRLWSLGDNFNWLLDANLRISARPDVTLLLLVSPETAFRRIGGRGWTSRFEQLDFLKDVQDNYRRLARSDDTIVQIDAERPLAEVVEDALAAVERSNV
ncbi:MAG: dTMP kinase [Methanobacteriota archaeon]|nr:MAG: dTMP kinase [Euryarchaeota archaeon]